MRVVPEVYKKENVSNISDTDDNTNDEDYNVYNANYDRMIKTNPSTMSSTGIPLKSLHPWPLKYICIHSNLDF